MEASDPILEALRKTYAKLLEIEKKVDALTAGKAQGSMKLNGLGQRKAPPEWTLLRGKMMQAWSATKGVKYEFHPRDAKGITSLLKRSMSVDELTARWVYAVKNGCVSIFEFDMNFNKWLPSVASHRPMVDGDIYGEPK